MTESHSTEIDFTTHETTVQPRLILASGSPRRRSLLEGLNLNFQVINRPINEEILPGQTPPEVVESLARQKAHAVATSLTTTHPVVIIAADTVVVRDGFILGKPENEEDALETLTTLQGRTHEVYTGVCVRFMGPTHESKEGHATLSQSTEKQPTATEESHAPREVVRHQRTEVTMRPRDEEWLNWYIQTGEPMDKAGCYGIQGYGALLVEKLVGDYFNVVGLPITTLDEMLTSIGWPMRTWMRWV